MASQTDLNPETNVNTGEPLDGTENDETGHKQDIQDEGINQHEVDAILAENGFSAFSTASRWTYKTIKEHSLISPLKVLARNATRVKTATLHRQQTKSAKTLSGQAEKLYRYLVDHKDIAAEIRGQGNGSAFNEGLAPWFVHLLIANENGVPPCHWQMGPSQYKEVIDLYVFPLNLLLHLLNLTAIGALSGMAKQTSQAKRSPIPWSFKKASIMRMDAQSTLSSTQRTIICKSMARK